MNKGIGTNSGKKLYPESMKFLFFYCEISLPGLFLENIRNVDKTYV